MQFQLALPLVLLHRLPRTLCDLSTRVPSSSSRIVWIVHVPFHRNHPQCNRNGALNLRIYGDRIIFMMRLKQLLEK